VVGKESLTIVANLASPSSKPQGAGEADAMHEPAARSQYLSESPFFSCWPCRSVVLTAHHTWTRRGVLCTVFLQDQDSTICLANAADCGVNGS